jgi:hypothetical protein
MILMRGWYYCLVKYVRPSAAKIDFIANKNLYDFVMNMTQQSLAFAMQTKAQREDEA